ncbi:hypothetical protein EDB89DRAFT_319391 [Lactarius sanguifluus]|nr:hypothetical protein EDB89DRAFT_319391 [Lactarius sanguifluus]
MTWLGAAASWSGRCAGARRRRARVQFEIMQQDRGNSAGTRVHCYCLDTNNAIREYLNDFMRNECGNRMSDLYAKKARKRKKMSIRRKLEAQCRPQQRQRETRRPFSRLGHLGRRGGPQAEIAKRLHVRQQRAGLLEQRLQRDLEYQSVVRVRIDGGS